jgi:predicted Zn finger-like uncharacterized protein
MRIACPNCSAEYDVPESLLAIGPRLLRCARCAHQFDAALPRAEPPPAPPPAPAPPPTSPPSAAPQEAARPAAPPPAPLSPDAEQDGIEAPPTLEATSPLVDRPPPTRGLSRHSPIDPPTQAAKPAAHTARHFAATVTAAWVASLVVIFVAGWATYTYHAEITAAWPSIARLYQALGVQ